MGLCDVCRACGLTDGLGLEAERIADSGRGGWLVAAGTPVCLEGQAAAFLVAKTLAWRQAGGWETSFARRFLKVGNLAQHLYDVFYLVFVMYSEREVCVEDAVHAVDVHFHDVELQL